MTEESKKYWNEVTAKALYGESLNIDEEYDKFCKEISKELYMAVDWQQYTHIRNIFEKFSKVTCTLMYRKGYEDGKGGKTEKSEKIQMSGVYDKDKEDIIKNAMGSIECYVRSVFNKGVEVGKEYTKDVRALDKWISLTDDVPPLNNSKEDK